MNPVFLYCGDPLRPRRVDPHFSAEAARVRELGGRVEVIDHDALIAGRINEATARTAHPGPAWYRGWMVPAHRYAQLAATVELITEPAMYSAAHELPGWYRHLAAHTPASTWATTSPHTVPARDILSALAAELPHGAGMVKDFVKSRKHEPDASFVPDLDDVDVLAEVVRRFVERQDDDLAGGVVLRHFEQFVHVDGRTAELRTWWVDGRAVLTGPHPDSPSPPGHPDLTLFASAIEALPSRFITCDVALRSDGVWRIIEIGDGQVSDLPGDIDPSPLLRALLEAPTTGVGA
ncbi:MAG TPA: ATP-grasp domain-containing protein [Candidatus Stackebrandtia excrementipullorum]|nr:ATP-grasp domain-containing protein [Candidatus Stackebrandtia excrementipullorum]